MPVISIGYKKNLETIISAAKVGRLAILDCQDKATGKPVVAVVAMSGPDANGEYDIIPLAKMFDSDPYDELRPPSPDGGYIR